MRQAENNILASPESRRSPKNTLRHLSLWQSLCQLYWPVENQ